MKLAAALAFLLFATPALALEKPRDWEPPPVERIPNHREEWRRVIMELASYAKSRNKDFVILVRGGAELAVKGEYEAQWEQMRDPGGRDFEKRLPVGTQMRPYLKQVDGLVVDGLYCGPLAFDKPLDKAIKDRRELDRTIADEKLRGIQRPAVPTPLGPFSIDPAEELKKAAEVRRLIERDERQRRRLYALDAAREHNRRLLSIETCKDQKAVDAAHKSADRDRVLSFATTGDDKLDRVPKGHVRLENALPVAGIGAPKNWLPVLRGDKFATKADWLMALEKTNEDLIVVDVAHRGSDPLLKDEIKRLKYKEVGAPRLVMAVMPIGRAYDWRWYWQKGWEAGKPSFLFAPDDEPGAFITDLSDPKWREVLGKYLAGIIDSGFDGVMLDDIDTYLWFEELMPVKG